MQYTNYTVTTDYIGGYQYETKPVAQGGRGYAQLLFFPTAQGYIKALYHPNTAITSPKKYQYIYLYKDHLGNNRLSYTLDPETEQVKILEENHYYPFGLKHNTYVPTKKDVKYQELAIDEKEIKQVQPAEVVYKYKYNSKELQDELGLGVYDYGARIYDPAVPRFWSIDPLAEKRSWLSPYNYVQNNPIMRIDPDGQLDWIPDKHGNLIAEKGDNAQTLAEAKGYKDPKGKGYFKALNELKKAGYNVDKNGILNLKEGDILKQDNNMTRAIERSNKTKDYNINTDAYNCHDGANMVVQGKEVKFENILSSRNPKLKEIKPNQAVHGKTIIKIGGIHSVVFYNRSRDGTVYVFSKNGHIEKPKIISLNEVYKIPKFN